MSDKTRSIHFSKIAKSCSARCINPVQCTIKSLRSIKQPITVSETIETHSETLSFLISVPSERFAISTGKLNLLHKNE